MDERYERERQEAIAAGERALESLNAARDALSGARNWGVLDILGGGLFSTMIKRSHMSDAQRAMERAGADLETFRRELGDVHMSLDMGDFLGFADYFFDGLFVDMIVQSRIAEAQRQVEGVTEQVERLLAQLMG
jgi:hypothetical protein